MTSIRQWIHEAALLNWCLHRIGSDLVRWCFRSVLCGFSISGIDYAFLNCWHLFFWGDTFMWFVVSYSRHPMCFGWSFKQPSPLRQELFQLKYSVPSIANRVPSKSTYDISTGGMPPLSRSCLEYDTEHSPSGVIYNQALYHLTLCSLHIFLFHLQ